MGTTAWAGSRVLGGGGGDTSGGCAGDSRWGRALGGGVQVETPGLLPVNMIKVKGSNEPMTALYM